MARMCDCVRAKFTVDAKTILLQKSSAKTSSGRSSLSSLKRKGDDGLAAATSRRLFESMELDQMRRGVLKK